MAKVLLVAANFAPYLNMVAAYCMGLVEDGMHYIASQWHWHWPQEASCSSARRSCQL